MPIIKINNNNYPSSDPANTCVKQVTLELDTATSGNIISEKL